jgi:hypothetical protein
MTPPSVDQDPRQPTRLPRDVQRWRRDVLVRAGFDDDAARDLAAASGVDLHEALTLVDRGCPPELAARILAPI